MSIVLKQIKINCPGCGEYLWRLTHVVYNLTTQKNETKEDTPVCQKCKGLDYIQALRSAVKIIPLTLNEKDARVVSDAQSELSTRYDDAPKKKPK